MVASSMVMQFLLKTPADEVPIDRDALLGLKNAVGLPVSTRDQERFFKQAECMLHEVFCPEHDDCWQCQSGRYLVVEKGTEVLRVACSCCGNLSALESGEHIELVDWCIPTASQLARARAAT